VTHTTIGWTPLDEGSLVAGTSTSQHSIFTKDKHPHPGGIRTLNPSNQAAETYTTESVATGTAVIVKVIIIIIIIIIILSYSSELDISNFKVIIFIPTKLHDVIPKKIAFLIDMSFRTSSVTIELGFETMQKLSKQMLEVKVVMTFLQHF
jgi:hypothetical protein